MQYYFAQLGLPPTANAEEVKKAYRQLAKQHHPDIVGNSQEAVRRFQEIGHAYEHIIAYLNRPVHPMHYYSPYQPQYPHQPPPPQESGFQAYTWEPMKADATKKRPPPPPPKPKQPEPEPVVEEVFVSVISQELLLATQLEASQTAIRRAKQEKGDQRGQLQWDVNLFLKKDYTVETNLGMLGFTVTSNKNGRKVSVRPNTNLKKPNLFGGKSSSKS